MFVDLAPQWLVERRGESTERYDTPKCAFRGGTAGSLWFREYYSQEFVPLGDLSFVAGSDVIGPMGDDLVPVAPERADAFVRDHGGRVIDATDIDGPLLRSLDPP